MAALLNTWCGRGTCACSGTRPPTGRRPAACSPGAGIRRAFLSAPRVRDAYLGYAEQQLTRLLNKDADPRTPKHARHLLRLLHQGERQYATGGLTVRLDEPQRYGCRWCGCGAVSGLTVLQVAEGDF